MREYTFLLSDSFRTPHVQARSLREAYRMTKIWYVHETVFRKRKMGKLLTTYQVTKRGVDSSVMSGWLDSKDKSLKECGSG